MGSATLTVRMSSRLDFTTYSQPYYHDERKLSRYRNPYKQPDSLAVADASFDVSTSYTEQYLPNRTRSPGLVRHPWESSNLISAGPGPDGLEVTTTNDEYYKHYADPWRPGLAYSAKLPHILPQGGVSGETEYEDRYVPKRSIDSRVMPRWYTWNQDHQLRSPFGVSAKKHDQPGDATRSRPESF